MEPNADRVLHLIKALKRRIGCVTNSHRPIVEETLRHFRLCGYFETVVTAENAAREHSLPW
jgi:FMN phosphatase YigB (HAD superfamily)